MDRWTISPGNMAPTSANAVTADFALLSGITAASVALSDAGIQAYGLVIGCCAVSDRVQY